MKAVSHTPTQGLACHISLTEHFNIAMMLSTVGNLYEIFKLVRNKIEKIYAKEKK